MSKCGLVPVHPPGGCGDNDPQPDHRNQRTPELFALERSLKLISFQVPCLGQRPLPLNQVAPSNMTWSSSRDGKWAMIPFPVQGWMSSPCIGSPEIRELPFPSCLCLFEKCDEPPGEHVPKVQCRKMWGTLSLLLFCSARKNHPNKVCSGNHVPHCSFLLLFSPICFHFKEILK